MITNENDNLKAACITSVRLIKKVYEVHSLICPTVVARCVWCGSVRCRLARPAYDWGIQNKNLLRSGAVRNYSVMRLIILQLYGKIEP